MKVSHTVLIPLIGVAIGIGGTVLGPRPAGQYVPQSLRGKPPTIVEGQVVRKQREGDRLLLTVATPEGSILVTFRKKVTEIELLVAEGDTLTLALRRYEPFVENPEIERVRKPKSSGPEADQPGPASASGGGAGEKGGR